MAEYIEREALIKQVMANFRQASWYGCDNPLYSIVEETILEAPTSDVAPVVHGRWDKDGRCTNRGGHAPYWCMASTYYKSPFCLECGAKMDLE